MRELEVDATRHPRAASYLAQLPRGLNTYPECVGKGSIVRTYCDALRERNTRAASLPAPLAAWLIEPPPFGSWVSEVQSRALSHILFDELGYSDAAALRWTFERNVELLGGRAYRALSFVAFPELLLRGAGIRWNQFHRGTELSASTVGAEHFVNLRFPANLFDALTVRAFGEALRAVMTISRAKQVDIVVEAVSSRSARYRVDWARRSTPPPGW